MRRTYTPKKDAKTLNKKLRPWSPRMSLSFRRCSSFFLRFPSRKLKKIQTLGPGRKNPASDCTAGVYTKLCVVIPHPNKEAEKRCFIACCFNIWFWYNVSIACLNTMFKYFVFVYLLFKHITLLSCLNIAFQYMFYYHVLVSRYFLFQYHERHVWHEPTWTKCISITVLVAHCPNV